MHLTLAMDSRPLALELYRFLRDLDPARWSDSMVEGLQQQVARLRDQVRVRLERAEITAQEGAPRRSMLRNALADLSQLLSDHAPAAGLHAGDLRDAWMAYRKRLMDAYDALVTALRTYAVHVPDMRPTNHARNIFHVATAAFSLILLEYVFPLPVLVLVAGAFALVGWSLEISRRFSKPINNFCMVIFSKVAHPHEHHRINSATWYTSALVILALTGSQMLGAVALVVLGLSDPAASLVGRRWGRRVLINGRTLEGTATFIVVGTVAALAALMIWHPPGGWVAALSLAFGAAVSGGLAELVCRRVDDNLVVPLAAAAGASVVAMILQIPV